MSESELQKFQTWRAPVQGSNLVLTGNATLRIWAKMKASSKKLQLQAFLRECTSTTEASCTTVATGNMSQVTNASTSFTEYPLSFGAINTTIDMNNRLQIRVVMLDISNADPAYLAYDTTTFRARLIIN